MRDFFKPHYRIVTDPFRGYTLEVWCWFWPFWVDANPYRSFSTLEEAEQFAAGCASIVVKNLGTMKGKKDD